MTRAVLLLAAAALTFGFAGPAAAAEPGRYLLKDVENGFIRLDTASGEVSHCRSRDGAWRCEPVADARAALDDEIARLVEENTELRQRLARLEAEQHSGRATGPVLKLPSEEDIDRAMGVFERFMQRFIDFARGLNQDHDRAG